MTEKELKQALEFINNKLEQKYNVSNFFYYGDLDIPDMKDLRERQFSHFFNLLEEQIKKKAKSSNFKHEFRNRIEAKINEKSNLSIVMAHFTLEEIKKMRELNFPIEIIMKGETLDEEKYPKLKEFYSYILNEIDKKIKNDFVNTYMRYWKNIDPIETILLFPFDEVKQYELKVLKDVKRYKHKGLIFSNNSDNKIHLICNFPNKENKILTFENHSASFLSQKLESMKIVDFFTNIRNHLFEELSLEETCLNNSDNKEWTKEFFKFRKKDIEMVDEALKVLDEFKYENITEGKIISY